MTSNATYVLLGRGFYFEGTNILVKIDGTDAPAIRSQGVVFSAHYDSVSTAPGATDNGMGVATLLQMVEYLSVPERRPRRTAVFLFNNGEEDGLNGVHAYFEHPWSNLTTTFVNLEGAAAGG
jgi:Zn-dependent M28 family amino/carboxypeptidase